MWPFNRNAPSPRRDFCGPISFTDWTEEDIDFVSKAIRKNGQPESEGFRRFARIALNTLRNTCAVELVARAMEESSNPGSNADAPIDGNHYQRGMPRWCMWVEYARPAVEAISQRYKLLADASTREDEGEAHPASQLDTSAAQGNGEER